MKILSSFIILTILLGITATSLSGANFVNAQQGNAQQVDIITPQSSGIGNSLKPMIDLNAVETTTLSNLLIQCPSGLFVYTGINGQLVIACLIDGVYGKLFNSYGQEIFNIDIDIENNNGNENNNNNNRDDDDDNNDRDCGPRGNFSASFWEKQCEKFEDIDENGGSNMTGNSSNSNDNNNDDDKDEQEIPLIDITKDPVNPVIPLVDIEQEKEQTETENGDTNGNGSNDDEQDTNEDEPSSNNNNDSEENNSNGDSGEESSSEGEDQNNN